MANIKKLAETNADHASQILRAMVSSAPSYLMVPLPVLAWYKLRRQLDLLIADEDTTSSKELKLAAMEGITDDIRRIEESLTIREDALEEPTTH